VFSITISVIDDRMRTICQELAKESFITDFYLAGGTALAMQLQHRKSVDLDFFTPKEINVEQVLRWLDNFPKTDTEVIFRKIDQLDLKIKNVKTSFIFYPFPVLDELLDGSEIEPGFSGLNIAPAREIALMKAYVLGRRTSFRDYIDLYYLLKKGITSLEQIITDCHKKYMLEGESVFSGKLFLQQLAYTEDILDQADSLSYLSEKGLSEETISAFLREQVSECLKSINFDHSVQEE